MTLPRAVQDARKARRPFCRECGVRLVVGGAPGSAGRVPTARCRYCDRCADWRTSRVQNERPLVHAHWATQQGHNGWEERLPRSSVLPSDADDFFL